MNARRDTEACLDADDYLNILGTLDDNIAIIDQNFTIVWVNENWTAFARENNLTQDYTTVGRNYLSVFMRSGEYDRSNIFRLSGIRQVLEGRAPDFQYEYPCMGPDCKRWCQMKINPVIIQGTKHFMIRHTDITRRVQAEHRKLHSIIDNMHGYIGLYSLDGKLLDANMAPVEAAGLEREDVIGKPFWDTFWWAYSDEQQHRVRDALTRAAQGEFVRDEFTAQLDEDTFIDIDATFGPVRDDAGRVVKLLGFGVDISARKHAEARARESEIQLSEILDIAPEAIVSISDTLEIAAFNKGAERIFGYTADEVLGKPLTVLMPERYRENHDRLVDEFRKSEDTYRMMDSRQEITGLKKDGSEFPASASVSKSQRHGATLFTVTLHDASERKSKERAHRKALEVAAEANMAKASFLASMSHEIRTPLNAIIGFSEALEHGVHADDPLKQRDTLRVISTAGKQLTNLIGDILDYSKLEAGQSEPEFDDVLPSEVFDENLPIIRQMLEKRDISLDERREEDRKIRCDRRYLGQIVLNFMSNAAKYSKDGGHVEIGTELRPDDMMRIYVKDSGIGVSDNVRDKIFLPFERGRNFHTSIDGMGLGLSICKKLTEAMHGEIGFDSEGGKGSTFWVDFPTADS